jgi:hypothetical protein
MSKIWMPLSLQTPQLCSLLTTPTCYTAGRLPHREYNPSPEAGYNLEGGTSFTLSSVGGSVSDHGDCIWLWWLKMYRNQSHQHGFIHVNIMFSCFPILRQNMHQQPLKIMRVYRPTPRISCCPNLQHRNDQLACRQKNICISGLNQENNIMYGILKYRTLLFQVPVPQRSTTTIILSVQES